jgi:uncharacterized membrane protein (DUF485 family)
MFGNQANFQELQRKLSTFATFGIRMTFFFFFYVKLANNQKILGLAFSNIGILSNTSVTFDTG